MKKFLITLTVFVCTVAIGLSIYSNESAKKESNLMRQNIEALAGAHSGGGIDVDVCCVPYDEVVCFFVLNQYEIPRGFLYTMPQGFGCYPGDDGPY